MRKFEFEENVKEFIKFLCRRFDRKKKIIQDWNKTKSPRPAETLTSSAPAPAPYLASPHELSGRMMMMMRMMMIMMMMMMMGLETVTACFF